MPQYDDTNRGALFRNDKEGGNPNWPDYRGNINVGGVEYYLDAWIKEGKKGKFMSLSVKPKQPKPAQSKSSYAEQSQHSLAAQAPAEFDDSDIPF